MSRAKLLLVFVAGLLLGVIVAIKLFAIKDIEVRSLPYENQGVVLQEQVVVKQNEINLILPKGTELNVLYRGREGSSVYYIPLTFGPYQEPRTNDLATRAKLFKEPGAKTDKKSQK